MVLIGIFASSYRKSIAHEGLKIEGCQWPKAGHILEMAGKNKFELPK
jgi:hypothetical protein